MQGKPMSRVLDDVVALDPDRTALIIDGQRTSYAELDAAVGRAAVGLRAAGVAPGWHIPLVDDTSLLAVATLIGATHLGAATALMNPRLTSGELAVLMEAAGTVTTGVVGRHLRGGGGRGGDRPRPGRRRPARRRRGTSTGADRTRSGERCRRPVHQWHDRDTQGRAAHARAGRPPDRRLRAGRRPRAGGVDHVRPSRAHRGDAGSAGRAGQGLDHRRPDPIRCRASGWRWSNGTA